MLLKVVKKNKTVAKNNAHKLKTSKKTNKKCYFCGKPGHFKADCYHYKKNPHKEEKRSKDEAATFVCQAKANVCKNSRWIADNSASFHMIYDRNLFCKLDQNRDGESIKLEDKKVISKDIGKVKVDAWRSGRWKEITLEEVRWVPNLKKNLFAFNAATKHEHKIITTMNDVTVMHKS